LKIPPEEFEQKYKSIPERPIFKQIIEKFRSNEEKLFYFVSIQIMTTTIIIFSVLLIVLSVLPFSKNQHWIFRVPEFMKIQLLILQLVTIVASAVFLEKTMWFWLITIVQLALVVYHLYLLIRYTTFYRRRNLPEPGTSTRTYKIISANVFQFNTEYEKFHQLIQKHQPDIFITVESNEAWEKANEILEKDYPHSQKMPLENTYGMHLYSKIPFEKAEFHFYVADDVPSIEAHFKTEKGERFVVFGVHPPPPSPTEERTSKERDGDLLALAKNIRTEKHPAIVIGDFNTVAWSDTSILFRKTSELIDAREGRGILATFHAKYWFFRVPLDLFFHSPQIFVKELKTLEYFGSDHFPILCEFYLDHKNGEQHDDVVTLKKEELKEVNSLIVEGIFEESDNRTDKTE
jgi:endonuclease/exonuclease/phosphatase (EEP) superfamily protein YafD